MATVRMSERLKYAITSEAQRQFDNVNEEKELPMEIGDKIYEKHVKPFVTEAKALIKKHNFESCLEIQEYGELQVNIISNVSKETTHRTEINMSASRECPKGSYHDAAAIKISNVSEEGKAISAILYENEDMEQRGRDYKEKVQVAIENFSTLNQALKAWPAIKKLIPEEEKWALQRVYEKVERKKKTDEQRAEIELNEAELNSVILTNSLIGDKE